LLAGCLRVGAGRCAGPNPEGEEPFDMMRALFMLAAATTCAAVITSTAAAQRIDSPYRFLDHRQHLGVYAGAQSAAEGLLGLGPQASPTFGARWSIRLSGPLALGADLSFTPAQRTVRDTVFVAEDSVFRALGDVDMQILALMGDVRFNITGPRTWHGLQPFVGLGVGVARDMSGRTELEDELEPGIRFSFGTSFAGQFGAGVDWFPVERLSLRIDARNRIWRIRAPETFGLTEAGRTTGRATWENSALLSAGVSYHF
jgi:opacity protein-like surface antigen